MYTTRSKFVSSNRDFNQTICWKMLSDDQCEEIFVTAAELLERSGAEVDNEAARAVFAKNGCWVEGKMVHIPSAKLKWAIRTAPSRLTLCDQKGKRAVLMETENVSFGPGYGAEKIIDRKSGERRGITIDDVADLARLGEKLKHIAFLSTGAAPAGCRKETASLHSLEKVLTNSTKPVVMPVCCEKEAACAWEMASIAVGGKEKLRRNPYLVFSVTCDETRYHSDKAMSSVMFAAEHGVPFIYNSKLISGQTAPNTTAGTLVLALSNYLLALTLAQFVNEGTPVIAGGHFTLYDEQNDTAPFGAPEASLTGSGFSNLLRWLRLPNAGISGITDSVISDAQMGAEMAMGLITSALAGSNMIMGSMLESGKTVNLPALAICEEVMAEIYRMMSSFIIDEDRKAVGVYDAVGPGGGYLGEEHTNRFFKSEQYWPNLFCRLRIEDWKAAGSTTMGQRAAVFVNDLLAEAEPAVCGKDVADAIKAVIANAEKQLQK